MKITQISIAVASLMALLVFNSSTPKRKDSDKKYKEVSHLFYAASYEVTNKEFKEYLQDIKTRNIEEYEKNYPDTTLWMKKFPNSFNQPMVENYFVHSAFDNYPVVSITKEAAEDYCS